MSKWWRNPFSLQLWNVVKANGGSFKRHPQDARRHELWPHYSFLWLRVWGTCGFDFAFSDVGVVARWQPLAQGAVHSDLSGYPAYSDSAKVHSNSVVLKSKLKDNCQWHWTIWTAWAWHVLIVKKNRSLKPKDGCSPLASHQFQTLAPQAFLYLQGKPLKCWSRVRQMCRCMNNKHYTSILPCHDVVMKWSWYSRCYHPVDPDLCMIYPFAGLFSLFLLVLLVLLHPVALSKRFCHRSLFSLFGLLLECLIAWADCDCISFWFLSHTMQQTLLWQASLFLSQQIPGA